MKKRFSAVTAFVLAASMAVMPVMGALPGGAGVLTAYAANTGMGVSVSRRVLPVGQTTGWSPSFPSDVEVDWSTVVTRFEFSDPTVAEMTEDENGYYVIKGLKPGTTTFTLTNIYTGETASTTIFVVEEGQDIQNHGGMTIQPEKDTIQVGEKINYWWSFPEGTDLTQVGGVDTSIEDTSIANFSYEEDHTVKIIGLKAGTTRIYASNSDGTYTASAQITVVDPSAPVSSFSDVPADAAYADAVTWAVNKGVVKGYSNGNFGTNDPILRQDFAVMLYRLYQADHPDAGTAEVNLPFTDAGNISPYAREAASWASANKYINGYSDGRLGPKDYITNEQVAAILRRYFQGDDSAEAAAYSDLRQGRWYSADVNWLASKDVTPVTGTTTFGVGQNCSRAETVYFMWKAANGQ